MRHLHLMDEFDQVLQQSRKFCTTTQAALEPQVIFHLSASPVSCQISSEGFLWTKFNLTLSTEYIF